MHRHVVRWTLLALVVLASWASSATAQVTPAVSAGSSLDLVLKPELDAAGNVITVDVTLRFADTIPSASFALEAPQTLFSHAGIADRLGELRLTDPSGAVALIVSDEGTLRRWRPARPVVWPVVVRYRALVPQSRLAAGPPIDLRTFAGGVSFGGRGLLALPRENRPYRIRLQWDLSGLAPGSTGVSSLGEGDLDLTAPLSSLSRSFYLAGPVERYPQDGDISGFAAFWLGGKDDVDMRSEMAWAAEAYAKLRAYFGDTTPRPFRFFTRVLPEESTSGGTASINSFMLQVPKPTAASPEEPPALPRGIIMHEMIHGWVGGVSGTTSTQWFGEGATTYYTTMTGLKLGLVPLAATAREMTHLAIDYYLNPYRNVSADSAAGVFWLSKEGERVAYAKGSLYFMSLNARIQEASAGRRSLDDVMFPLFAQRAREGSLSTATFLSAIEKELGAGVRAEFDSVIIRGAGTVIVPPEALGLCFERHTVTTFVPDFIYRRNVGSQRIVTGLRGESAASAAGLQEADEVLNDVDPSALAATTSEPVMLEVRRGEQQVTLRYVPRPIFVDSYEWTKVPGIPDEICRRASSFEGTDRSRLTEAGRRRGIIRPSPARSPTALIPTNNRDP